MKMKAVCLGLIFAIGSFVQGFAEGNLIVGLESTFPPFEFKNDKGELVGFDVDVAKMIAEKMGKKLVIKEMEFDGVILSLQQGKIDLAITGMNIIPEREKEILMVPYHGEGHTSLTLLFWKKIPDGIHSLEDIAKQPNLAVSVESGSIPEKFLQTKTNIVPKSLLGTLSCLMDVKFKKSVANLVDPAVAEFLRKQHPEITTLSVPLPKDFITQGCGIGVQKENTHLYEKVSEIIEEMKTSGKMHELEEKWFTGKSL